MYVTASLIIIIINLKTKTMLFRCREINKQLPTTSQRPQCCRVLSDILDALDRGDFAVLVRCLTSQQRLTRLTMPLCCAASSQRMALPALHWSGSLRTFMRGRFLSVTEEPVRLHRHCCVEYHKFAPNWADTVPAVYGRPWTH